MRACGLQQRIVLGVSGCCDIVRVGWPVSGWYGQGTGALPAAVFGVAGAQA